MYRIQENIQLIKTDKWKIVYAIWKVYSNSIKTETVFTKAEINNE